MAPRLLALTLSLACGASAPTGPGPGQPAAAQLPAAETPTEPLGPAVRVLVEDPAADEGDFHSFVIRPDGSFEGEHVWSDGGAEDNRVACPGQLPEESVRQWFDYARSSATLEQPEPRAFEPGDGLVAVVAYEDEDGVMRHTPLERQGELLEWAQALMEPCAHLPNSPHRDR